jgi:tetratricopeptide (TPR) repeat protein
LVRLGRHGEAREELTAALQVLREEPDVRTVRALAELAMLESFSGSPDADADGLSTEAFVLGQALDVDVSTLMTLCVVRALYLAHQDRLAQAVAYLRETVRLATRVGDNLALGRALNNLADAEARTDPAAAVEDARAAADHLRQAGSSFHLGVAITTCVHALLMLGDWDGADAELRAPDADGLAAGQEFVNAVRGLVSALRGDVEAAQASLDAAASLRASEDEQDNAALSVLAAFTAAAKGQPEQALEHALATIAHSAILGMTTETVRWAWPLAARTAWQLGDSVATRELLSLVDERQPGHLGPLLRAERDLARARLAAQADAGTAGEAFAIAIRALRDHGTPYHLAHGLLDQAGQLAQSGDLDAAAQAVAEARDIGARLRCQPLIARASDLEIAVPSSTA